MFHSVDCIRDSNVRYCSELLDLTESFSLWLCAVARLTHTRRMGAALTGAT